VSFLKTLKERRLFQIMAAYAAAGWVVVQILGDLIERGLLPEIVFRVALVWYVGGFAAALVIGWVHGEKGRQQAPLSELVFLSTLALLVVVVSGFQVTEHMRDVRVAQAQVVGHDLSRVAVLYFEGETASGEDSYLGDALTEGLIERLQDVDGLHVVSRNGVLPFRGRNVRPDSIGNELGVGTLVTGSIEVTAERVRVHVRLLDGSSGFSMARASLERPREDIQAAVGAVAEEVARLFRQELGEEVRLRSIRSGTEDVVVWRAIQMAEKFRKDGYAAAGRRDAAAGELYQKADSLLAIAETRSGAWPEPSVLRAGVAFERAQQSPDRGERARWVERGVAHAERALALDPDHARALQMRGGLRLLAYMAHLAHDATQHQTFLVDARDDLERAVRLDRSLATAHSLLSVLYYQPGVGDLAAAALAARSAYEADAYLRTADDVLERLFWTNLDLGQFTQAGRWCMEGRRRFPQDPRFVTCQLWQMTAPGSDADLARAWELQQELPAMVPAAQSQVEDARGRMLMAAIIGRGAEGASGDRRRLLADSARSVLDGAHDAYMALDEPHRELLGIEGFAWVILDDLDRAIQRLKVYAALNHGFQQAGDISWRWRKLRDHPRFNELVTRSATH
jgi:TolB-like protein